MILLSIISHRVVYEFTVDGIKMITGEFFTEREWASCGCLAIQGWFTMTTVYFSLVRRISFMRLVRTTVSPNVTTLSNRMQYGCSTIRNDLLVYKPQNIGKPLCRWWAKGQERMCGVAEQTYYDGGALASCFSLRLLARSLSQNPT